MWEDVGAWNSYADSGGGDYTDYSSADWMNDSSMWSGYDWGADQSSYADPNNGWNWGNWEASAPASQPAASYSWNNPLDYIDSQAGNPSTQMYNYYRDIAGGGDVNKGFERAASDRWIGGAGNSIPVRNAEHALFSEAMVRNHPIMGPVAMSTGVPAYNAAKWAAQNIPGVARITDAILPKDMALATATPPSWEALMWGLKPFWPQPFRPVR